MKIFTHTRFRILESKLYSSNAKNDNLQGENHLNIILNVGILTILAKLLLLIFRIKRNPQIKSVERNAMLKRVAH
jgi:hypothetical protein